MFGVKNVRLGIFMASSIQCDNLQTIGPVFKALEEGADRLSRKVGTELQLYLSNSPEEPDLLVYVFHRHNSSTLCRAYDMSQSVFYLLEQIFLASKSTRMFFFRKLEKFVKNMTSDLYLITNYRSCKYEFALNINTII